MEQILIGIQHFLKVAAGMVWSYPVVGLCLLGAIFFSLRLGLIQLRAFPHALALISGKYDNPDEEGEISHLQALSAALSGTVGIGNIGGVAIAIAIGGPGAVLWMWVLGFFAMATKYAECSLATHYRVTDPTTGEVRGGPMYYMTEALGPKWRPFALFYAITIGIAGLGFACMFQTNQASTVLAHYYNVPGYVTGLLFVVLGGVVIIGGIHRIGTVAARLIPLMCGIYMFAALVVCVLNWWKVPAAFWVIIQDGLTGQAAAGGSVGAVIQYGIRRAIFSNEAGLGSAAIAHAAVKTDYPIREGIVASLGPFIDTIVVSSATALVVILSGFYGTEMYQGDKKQTASFEVVKGALPTGWSQQTKDIPKERGVLQKRRDGKAVLVYKSPKVGTSALTLKQRFHHKGAIRLSYYRTKGKMQVQLLSEKGKVLAKATLGAKKTPKAAKAAKAAKATKKKTNKEAFALTTRQCAQSKVWASCVLLPNVALQKRLKAKAKGKHKQGRPFTLVFQPIGGPSEWMFDRVQSVSEVKGIALTAVSFDQYLAGFGAFFVSFAGFLFALSTLLSWSYYGETGIAYIFGAASALPYRLLFLALAFVGAVQSLETVINFSDLMVGLLVIPNMIALILLSGQVSEWTKTYFDDLKSGKIRPYAEEKAEKERASQGASES